MTVERAKTAVVVFIVVLGGFLWGEARDFSGRQERRDAQVTACARGLLDRADDTQGDEDLAEFASDASIARRIDGNLPIARKYSDVASRARTRAASRQSRLLSADLGLLLQRKRDGTPAPDALAEAHKRCSAANPPPKIIAF